MNRGQKTRLGRYQQGTYGELVVRFHDDHANAASAWSHWGGELIGRFRWCNGFGDSPDATTAARTIDVHRVEVLGVGVGDWCCWADAHVGEMFGEQRMTIQDGREVAGHDPIIAVNLYIQ